MLFRLKLNPELKGDPLLGYAWIDVLAIEPWGLSKEDDTDIKKWVFMRVCSFYICRVPEFGLIRITSADLWHALGEDDGDAEYIERD